MIHFIKGELVTSQAGQLIVENGGIGYLIEVPLSVVSSLPLPGQTVEIYTELYVREDILKLYGFLSESDLQVFQKLITVSGVGPKAALNILSVLTPEELRLAVLDDDPDRIARAKGVGKKTASKLIIELKDKLELPTLATQQAVGGFAQNLSVKEEAIEALMALGYNYSESAYALKELPADSDVEEAVRYGLVQLVR